MLFENSHSKNKGIITGKINKIKFDIKKKGICKKQAKNSEKTKVGSNFSTFLSLSI